MIQDVFIINLDFYSVRLHETLFCMVSKCLAVFYCQRQQRGGCSGASGFSFMLKRPTFTHLETNCITTLLEILTECVDKPAIVHVLNSPLNPGFGETIKALSLQ